MVLLAVSMFSAAAAFSRAAAGQCSVADRGLQALLVVHRVLQVVCTVHLEALPAGLPGHSVAHQALPADPRGSNQPVV